MTSQIRETILRQAEQRDQLQAIVNDLQDRLRERDATIERLSKTGTAVAAWLESLIGSHWTVQNWDSLVEAVGHGG
jgi:hypothetical protein